MTLPENDVRLEHVLALGDTTPVGRYRVDLATERWWWSDETFHIHGFEPGDVVPTTAMVLAHKHPEDRERVKHVLEDARSTGDPFASVHRIVDARGGHHVVSIVGQGRRDASGAVVELVGYVLDLTGSVRRFAAEQADDAIRAAARSRRHIEQAKAVVGLALDVDDDDAFEVLKRRSNDTNVPVRELAEHVVERARRTAGGSPALVRVLDEIDQADDVDLVGDVHELGDIGAPAG